MTEILDFDISNYYNNQTETPFIDEAFISNYGINEFTVLDYFYLSHFYEKNSINQRCMLQKVDFESNKCYFTGIEYSLYSNKYPYVISKSLRKSQNEVILISMYYCINNIIYQSPSLYSVLISNIQNITSNIEDISNEINNFTY